MRGCWPCTGVERPSWSRESSCGPDFQLEQPVLQRSRKMARQEGCSPRRWITTSTERTTCRSCIDPRNVLAAQAADLPPGRGCTTHGESCTPAQIRPSPVDGIAMRAPWQRAGFHSWPSAPLLRYTKIDRLCAAGQLSTCSWAVVAQDMANFGAQMGQF